jgi:hypothetical protein
MAWFAPNGMVMPNWTPTTTGTGWLPPPILAPLAPVLGKVVILTGLDHQAIAEPAGLTGPAGPHAAGTGCFLNMISVNGHETDPARTSLDQMLLPALNGSGCGGPLLESLQLGIQGDNGLCDRANCDFSRTISWRAGVALPSLCDPQACFDRMFGGVSPSDSAQRAADRKSILDSVLSDAQSLAIKLSPADRLKLDEHTTRIRKLETRLERLGKYGPSTPGQMNGVACAPPVRPDASPPLNFDRGITPAAIVQTHIPLMVDLMALAFTCDITRAITFMLGNSQSNNDFAFLTGTSTPHHGTSNHDNIPSKLATLTTIDTWEIAQASALLQKLDAVIEADGKSILDHTTFYLSSEVADGATSCQWDMPVLVAGGASGGLKIDGRHINYIPDMPFPRPLLGPQSDVQTGRVFISMLRAHGFITDTFGMATGGPLPELMP